MIAEPYHNPDNGEGVDHETVDFVEKNVVVLAQEIFLRTVEMSFVKKTVRIFA
jgi:hypothetical protein